MHLPPSVNDGYYDAKTKAWREFPTTWMTVKAFKTLANNVLQSLHKGDPVLVTGSLSTEEWTKEGQKRSALVLEADGIGHDMAMGVSTFQRVKSGGGPDEQGYAGAGSGANGQAGSQQERVGRESSQLPIQAPAQAPWLQESPRLQPAAACPPLPDDPFEDAHTSSESLVNEKKTPEMVPDAF